MKLVPLHVNGQDLPTIRYWPARRDIVTTGEPLPAIIMGQTSNLGPSVSVRIQLCEVVT